MKVLTVRDLRNDYNRIVVQYKDVSTRKRMWDTLLKDWYYHMNSNVLASITAEYFGETA